MRSFQRIFLIFLLIIISFTFVSCKTTKTEIRNEPKVYITQYGAKYHSKDCYYLSQSKIAISRNKAIKEGYSACSYCKGKSTEYIRTEYTVEVNNNNTAVIILIVVGSALFVINGIFFFKYEEKLGDIPIVGLLLYFLGMLFCFCVEIIILPISIFLLPIIEWVSEKFKRK